jgi:hypothetical protein
MPSKVYAARKARMARDPEFKARVLASQAASRRNARLSHLQTKAILGIACGFEFKGGRHCWKGYEHRHGGKVYMEGH